MCLVMDKLPVYKTEGIIIKSLDLGELDRLITVYSRSEGKILARAISARKRESKLRGYLEPFTYSNFLLAKSKTIDIITDIEPIGNFSQLHGNLESLAYAYYFAELIDKLVVAPERDDKIWALIKRAMEVLNKKQNPPQPSFKKEGDSSLSKREVGRDFSFPAPLKIRGAGGVMSLEKIKSLFEQKLLEFLGHGIPKNKTALDVIQGLAGEEIKSNKFLEKVGQRECFSYQTIVA